MRNFGDINKFAIQYEFIQNPYDEDGLLKYSWGMLEFWAKRVPILRFKRKKEQFYYQWNLIYIIEWFCDNLKHILIDEQFSFDIKGKSATEIIEKSYKINYNDEVEMEKAADMRYQWTSQHGWFGSCGGSFLQDVLFRKVGDDIEISWDSRNLFKDEGVQFLNPYGVDYIDAVCFGEVVNNFIEDILNELLRSMPHNDEIMLLKDKINECKLYLKTK